MWDYLASSHQVLARLQERLGDLKAATSHHAASAEAFVQDEKPLQAAKAWQQYGGVSQDQFNWQDALDGYQKALVIAKEVEDDFFIAALEDSIFDMQEKVDAKNKKQQKRKGFFGKFRG
jgi:tetratricopeptide (TPR) repeat protein